MSLSKQLGLSLFAILFLVFVGSLWVNVANTRDFIEQQLESHAQDTATSLGLSITPYIGSEEDLPIIETMANAIFDRGYYQTIELNNNQGEVLLKMENPKMVDSVPTWFVNAFTIDAPISTTELNNGWNIAGSLTVISNPGFGYLQLWNNTVQSIWVISSIFLLGLALVYIVVQYIVVPIKSVIEQTSKISDRHFDTIKLTPKTLELKMLIESINKMSQKLNDMFGQLTKQSEAYKTIAYEDPLTHIENRRAFEIEFKQLLTDKEHHASGYVFLVRLSSLKEVNTNLGAEDGDNYVKIIGKLIKDTLSNQFDTLKLYRITGSDFCVIIENASHNEIEEAAVSLISNFNKVEKSEYQNGTAHLGITSFVCGRAYKQVMEEVDSALSMADGLSEKYQFAERLEIHKGNQDWSTLIHSLIERNTSDFMAQDIQNTDGTSVYQEWYARLPSMSNNDLIPMAQLIPASIRLDASQDIDKLIVENAFRTYESTSMEGKFGLNISRISILDDDFQTWFIKLLSNNQSIASNLVIEIPERAIVNGFHSLVNFIKKVKTFNVQITVERFGAQLAGIQHLQSIKPDYLKLDGRYIREIQISADNQLFVQSLISIAHGLGVKVIAETVETNEEFQWLTKSGVDFMQGYFISAPRQP